MEIDTNKIVDRVAGHLLDSIGASGNPVLDTLKVAAIRQLNLVPTLDPKEVEALADSVVKTIEKVLHQESLFAKTRHNL